MAGHVSEAAHIVLFGPNGQVGARLLMALEAAGYEVTSIDRARCDFASATAMDIAKIIRAVEPALVINAAAYTAVDKAEDEQALAMRINGEVPGFIAAACMEQHAKLLHLSTDYVFDGQRGAPYVETAETHPLNVYARSKLAGEQAVRNAGGHVFRLQWVYDNRGKNFFLTMKKLLRERDELRVVADQLGTPTSACAIAEAVVRAIPKIIDGALPADVYHLTAGGHTSWHGFACAIARSIGSAVPVLPITSAEYPTPAARPKDARMNGDKLASYGISMPHWREQLAQTIGEPDADA